MALVTLDKVARTMPPTGADVVLRTWRAWEERDMDTVVDGMRPDVVHDLSHYEGFPGEAVNAGVGPALESLATWMAWWRGYRQELVDTEEVGDRVLLHVRHLGEREGREIDEPIAIVFYLDDEQRVARWEPWSDVDAARAALRA
jgi:ketosteroid isomerase-like protein